MSGYRISEIVKEFTETDMISTYTDLPDFPDIRTRLLYAFLEYGSTKPDSERYALVASLLQLGTDTHDQVVMQNDNKEQSAARDRQLKVLAGDYFSSQFYKLLADAGQVSVVRQLTHYICEINRLKMQLYMKMKGLRITADEYMQAVVELKTQLYMSFENQMDAVLRGVWSDVLTLVTKCEVLFDEWYRLESTDDFHESWGFWYVIEHGSKEDRKSMQNGEWDYVKLRAMVHKYRLSTQLRQLLESTWKTMQAKTNEWLPEGLRSEIAQIGEPFRRFLAKAPALSEI